MARTKYDLESIKKDLKYLQQAHSTIFDEYYLYIHIDNYGNRYEIACILDDNCVRWSYYKLSSGRWERIGNRHEFSNDKKGTCLAHAEQKCEEIFNKYN